MLQNGFRENLAQLFVQRGTALLQVRQDAANKVDLDDTGGENAFVVIKGDKTKVKVAPTGKFDLVRPSRSADRMGQCWPPSACAA